MSDYRYQVYDGETGDYLEGFTTVTTAADTWCSDEHYLHDAATGVTYEPTDWPTGARP